MGIVNRVKLQSKFLLRTLGEGTPLEINDNWVFSTSSELQSTLVPLAEHQKKTVAGLQNCMAQIHSKRLRGTKTENSLFPSHPQPGDTDDGGGNLLQFLTWLITEFK